jgi:hypothetical protein
MYLNHVQDPIIGYISNIVNILFTLISSIYYTPLVF